MASQDWIDKDFYAVLGVAKDASDADIKKAYRKLARTHHPDQNQGDPAAEQKFKEISEGYAVLSDPQQRQEYDAIRAMGSGARFTAPGAGSSAGFEDVFGDLFTQGRGGRRSGAGFGGGSFGGAEGPDLSDLFGAFAGGGSQGFSPGGFGGGGGFGGAAPRPTKGADRTAETSISFRGAMEGTTVSLRAADGQIIDVRVPAGIKDGQKVRKKGKGSPGTAGPGDLMVTVKVKEHPFFRRDGQNLRITVPVSFTEAALGATISVPTLTGEVRVKVPAGSNSGKVLRLRGRGVPGKSGAGDLYVELAVQVPAELSDEARAAVEALAEATQGQNVRAGLAQQAAW
ncbi:MAG: DnaJ C-terminal domain-containing protein [Micrococcus sp.]|nr:DnaJ C-terminal domain-containing protein [Micrococcus sp.]